MGQPYTHGRYYHLYINGQYWGLYQTQERPEAGFAASYIGGEPEDYDVMKTVGAYTMGCRRHPRRLQPALAGGEGGFATNAAYYRAKGSTPTARPTPPTSGSSMSTTSSIT